MDSATTKPLPSSLTMTRMPPSAGYAESLIRVATACFSTVGHGLRYVLEDRCLDSCREWGGEADV